MGKTAKKHQDLSKKLLRGHPVQRQLAIHLLLSQLADFLHVLGIGLLEKAKRSGAEKPLTAELDDTQQTMVALARLLARLARIKLWQEESMKARRPLTKEHKMTMTALHLCAKRCNATAAQVLQKEATIQASLDAIQRRT